jgi:hypothetical protein
LDAVEAVAVDPQWIRQIYLALRALYRDVAQPLSMRMRAAIESLPYENPKLSAMAVTAMDPNSFAKALDRAIERANGARLIEGHATEVEDNGERG